MFQLAVTSFVGFAGFAVLLPVAPLWAVRGGSDAAGAGLVNGVLLACTVLTQLLVPRALQRFGWGAVLPVGMTLLGLPALLYAVSDELDFVLLLTAVRGMGFGVLTVTGSSAVAWLVEPGRRGQALGIFGLCASLPSLLLLPLGPWAAEQVGFWVIFVVSSAPLLGIVSARRLACVIDERIGPAGAARKMEHRPELGSVRTACCRLLSPMLLLLSVSVGGGALMTFIPQMVSSSLLAAVALFVMGLSTTLARWGAGAVADRRGAELFLGPLLLLAAAGMTLTAWSIVHLNATRAGALLLGIAIVGMSYGALQMFTLLVSLNGVRTSHHDVASAAWNISIDTGAGLGSVAVGAIAGAASFAVALVAAAAVVIAALPLAAAALERNGPDGHAP